MSQTISKQTQNRVIDQVQCIMDHVTDDQLRTKWMMNDMNQMKSNEQMN